MEEKYSLIIPPKQKYSTLVCIYYPSFFLYIYILQKNKQSLIFLRSSFAHVFPHKNLSDCRCKRKAAAKAKPWTCSGDSRLHFSGRSFYESSFLLSSLSLSLFLPANPSLSLPISSLINAAATRNSAYLFFPRCGKSFFSFPLAVNAHI